MFAEDGTTTRVLATYDNGRKPVYRVTFDDGSSTLAGAEHLWKVKGATERRKDLGWVTLTTMQLVERGVRVKNGRWAGRQFEIPQHGAVQYPEATLPAAPYLVGVWLGDGSRGTPAYSKPYGEVEEKINQLGYRTSRHQDDHVRILGWKIAEIGPVAMCLSCDRFIPEEYKRGSVEQRQALLGGLMDTDACIGDDGHMEYATTSQRLADDVVWLVRSLGGNAFQKKTVKRGWYHDDDGNRVDCRDCYRVTVRTTFNPFLIPHKAERWKDPSRSKSCSRYLTRYVDSIEREGDAECMCIEVEHPSRCYLANDFIVTHNTAVEAWLSWNFLLTRSHPNIAAVSITAENLADNLWKELAKWHDKAPLLKDKFEWKKTRIEMREKPATWWMSARSWPKGGSREEQASTLAGLHADNVMFILDESGGMPDAVMVSAEAALSSCIEGHIVQGGNPTHREGPLFRAHSARDRWHVVEVNGDPDNPKRSPRISLEWARDQIREYGRDDPWILVNVFGQFPPGSLNSLIGDEEVMEATRRSYQIEDVAASPKILGVDVALFGGDGQVIWPRQGLVAFAPLRFRGLNSVEGAGVVARKWNEFEADACFVDDTGGFGAGWIDQLRVLRKSPIGIAFSGRPSDTRFANKRTEMYFDAVKWIRGGGQLPPMTTPGMPELTAALTRTTYTARLSDGKMILEPKLIVKEKLGYSPDDGDAFVLTFAQHVTSARAPSLHPRMTAEYDPFASMRTDQKRASRSLAMDYQPFGGRG